ncbi:aminotransferase class I/II-fold pyridoxal phosphate-dependent enzyme [Alkalihalobacillus sp. MEB130]|uniref:aminotransferase class I/II-fold pyridoxal phosphate-dependent enzyme n=1 Tax=Alkalihalobacillus sp. MEB130 TaxID=2976704 RepID=UPI0028DFAF75|nr:aminotransferase class I/II-fold pyridoxal phosphate-dependent enzyme [Alkalihalobacillus sp. MEB130]MDT8862621.1 aminotransferase class I/II-fold pyridoxal phosphate-dependent enzyme [Alkalihalobacillus sp. MEB130]
MTYNDTPLIKAIHNYKKNNPTSFHVPGHKNGLFFHESIYKQFEGALGFDVTELAGLDDLHAPTGAISEAQKKAANFYKAKETFFLVGGSTVGNLAMIYGAFNRGDTVFVQRNSHKSVFHALEIAGVVPILLTPEFDQYTELPIGISEETLVEALHDYPEAKGLVLTYPNYYGVSIDLKATITYAKRHRLLVLVDEAHAAHYAVGSPFPTSTLNLGADVVVQSAHKMLPALTMSSFLHINDKLSDYIRHSIKEALTMFQSSSPSYLLMASLDGARSYAEALSKEEINQVLAGVQEFKKELTTIKQIKIVNWPDAYLCDPLKVTIRTTTNLTGFQLQDMFMKHNLYPELADDKHVLLVCGLGVSELPFTHLHALRQSLEQYEVIEEVSSNSFQNIKMNSQKLELSSVELRRVPKKRVHFEEAVDAISAEAVIPYPPGIPIVLPGERITKQTVEQIEKLIAAGATFQTEQEVKDVLVVDSEDSYE